MSDELRVELARLRKEIASLREENELLTDKAEDIYLLGGVSEKIEEERTFGGVISVTIESVSSLKDIGYGSYLSIGESTMEVVDDYGLGLKESLKGMRFPIDEQMISNIEGRHLVVDIERDDMIPDYMPDVIDGDRPGAYIILPVSISKEIKGMFMFAIYDGKREYLDNLRPLLERITGIVRNRLENIELIEKVSEINRTLEHRVSKRTEKLVEANAQLGMEIKDRKRAQDALKTLASKLESIIEQVPEGIFLLDKDGRIEVTNPVASVLLRILADVGTGDIIKDIKGLPIYDLIISPPDYRRHEISFQGETDRLFEIGGNYINMNDPSDGTVYVIREITRDRMVEEKIQSQGRIAAIGQLAAGIAHDFNNILTGIIGYSELLAMDESLNEKQLKKVSSILQNGQRGAMLIKQILDFSRRSLSSMTTFDMEPFIKEFIKFIERTLPENIEIRLDHDEGDHFVEADPTKVQQVLANLTLNARDSMPDGGEMTIRLSHIEVNEGDRVPHPDLVPGEWVELDISDTGVGIEQSMIQHIFEPFFTTKEQGKGTGLGLSQVYGIVKQHNGAINVSSTPGKGTEFTIYLPAAHFDRAQAADRSIGTAPEGKGETILVVEDDNEVRGLIGMTLVQLGYKFLAAPSGEDAIRMFNDNDERVKLIITDIVMPGMSGFELGKRLREKYPNVRIIAMSGYPLGIDNDRIAEAGISEMLAKPINITDLAEAVKRNLPG
ncbi:MAG: response regulator [Nitrospirota bacterium]|nr:MAG: response regulator [Nitrospirota bacterium]